MLTDYQIGLWWMRSIEGRKIEVSHGGDRGYYYANLIDENGESLSDGVGASLEDAIGEAARNIRIETLMAEGGD